MYDYREEMKADIYEYILDSLSDNFDRLFDGITAADVKDDPYDVADRIADQLFCTDSVTGNASGSYFCNSWLAQEAVLDNLELLRDAYECFGSLDQLGKDFVDSRWEAMDVTIRCYLLFGLVEEIMDEVREAIEGFQDDYMQDSYAIARRLAA